MFGADEPAVMAALLPEAPPPHGAILPPVQAPPAIAQRIFPEIREKMRGNPPFADCPPPLGFAFFSGARKPAGFSRRGAQVGENALQAFSERAAAAFRLRAFLSRDKDWRFRDGGRLGDFAPDF